MAERVLRTLSALSDAAAVVSAAAFVFMTVLILAEVFLRAFFSKSTLVASEYSGYLVAAMMYLGLGFTFKEGGHIRIAYLEERLTRWGWLVVDIACTGLAVVVCAMSSYFMADTVLTSYQRNLTAYSILETPLYIPQAVILVGLVILTLQTIGRLVQLSFSSPITDSPDRKDE